MALGGLLAISDRRYRLVSRKVKEEKASSDESTAMAGKAVTGES